MNYKAEATTKENEVPMQRPATEKSKKLRIGTPQCICPYFKDNRCLSPYAGKNHGIALCATNEYTTCLIFRKTRTMEQEEHCAVFH